MYLVVKQLDGTSVNVQMPTQIQILKLKSLLQKRWNIPIANQRIIYQDKELYNRETIGFSSSKPQKSIILQLVIVYVVTVFAYNNYLYLKVCDFCTLDQVREFVSNLLQKPASNMSIMWNDSKLSPRSSVFKAFQSSKEFRHFVDFQPN